MKGQTDQLIAAVDDLLIAEAAGHRQRQIILLGLLDQVQHPIQQITDFDRLTIQALGKQNRELGRFDLQNATDDGRIDPLRAGRDQRMPLLNEGARHKLDQMNRNHRHMAAAEHSDAALSLVLQQRQLLSQGVHPIKRRKI